MNIGRKIIYQLSTGNVLVDCGERSGSVIETTLDQDFQAYTALQGIQESSVGVIQCDYGYELSNFTTYPYHIDITKEPIAETSIVWDTINPIGATLADVQATKIAQVTDLSNQVTYSTFTSTAFDGNTIATYACDLTSQARINGEATTAMAVLGGYSKATLSWENTSQTQCVVWQPQNMINLFNDLHSFLTTQTDYLESLIIYINGLTTVATVNAVTYGMTIPTI